MHGRTRTARFTISEWQVAVDWQETMVLRRWTAYPLSALTDIGPAAAASKHTTAAINHTRLSPRKHSPGVTPLKARWQNPTTAYYSFIDLERIKG